MRIHIIHTKGSPLEAYEDEAAAYQEYKRLRDMDDYVEYSLISLPIIQEDQEREK